MKELKLYAVTVGRHDEAGDNHNVKGVTVLAHDVEEAVGKVQEKLNLAPEEYIEECKLIGTADLE